MSRPLSPVLTYVLPFSALVLLLIAEFLVPTAYKPGFNSENGPMEIAQSAILAIALCCAVPAYLKAPTRLAEIWTGIAFLGLFYVFGEEISWGQWVFHWTTPADWAAINDQDETNLHNTSSWFDQKPRILIEIGVLIGGLVIPGLKRIKAEILPRKFVEIYPDSQVSFTAGLAAFAKFSDFLSKLDIKIFWRASEVVELYVYYFILLYLLTLIRKWRIKTEG